MFRSAEPEPFEVINPNGTASLLITCDHAANRIPESLRGLAIDASLLEQHIAYDIGAKQVAILLSQRLDAPLLLSRYSRLVIDLNRHLDDPTLIPEVSDRQTIYGNLDLTERQKQERIEKIFRPYHRVHREIVDRLIQKHRSPSIFSIHSFTPAINGRERPWHYGVLWDKYEHLAKKLIAGFKKNGDVCVGENQPYHATDPLGYSMVVHAQDRGVEMGLLEIRQDLVAHEGGQRQAAQTIAAAIQSTTEGN